MARPTIRRRGSASLVVLLAACGLLALAVPAAADLGAYQCVDASKVYLGNAKLFQKPAVISADKVYAQIAEYREIVEKGLTEKDPRYHFLMKKASERFSKAVKASARAFGHDLVAEVGAVEVLRKDAEAPPDRT